MASIAKTVEKTIQWLSELAEELGRPGDQQYAYRVLRGFLHTLRDRLTVEEAAHLGAQLPELLRGIYYEGWRPSTTPASYHDARTFLAHIRRESVLAGETEAAYATTAAATVLRRHVSAGELDDVVASLPRHVAELLTASGTSPTAS
ncbi:MAG: DUF2267 domain-containing protein [Mycobacterium leprae]